MAPPPPPRCSRTCAVSLDKERRGVLAIDSSIRTVCPFPKCLPLYGKIKSRGIPLRACDGRDLAGTWLGRAKAGRSESRQDFVGTLSLVGKSSVRLSPSARERLRVGNIHYIMLPII